jgi:DhnA family fructose-bisphosphate aldolase class Ia
MLRLTRFFRRESDRAFVVAADRPLLAGPVPDAEDLRAMIALAVACEPDGLLLSPGALARCADLVGHREGPAAMVRCDWFALESPIRDLGEAYRLICSPRQALALGADAIMLFLVLQPGDPGQFADNVATIGRACEDAHRHGLPVLVEPLAVGERARDSLDPDLLSLGCRMAAELGADAIKVQPLADDAAMAELVRACPVPVLALGGPRTDPEALLASTRRVLDAGARGVVYGRNVWQAEDAVALAARLREAVHGA